jgi:hypothetical protein
MWYVFCCSYCCSVYDVHIWWCDGITQWRTHLAAVQTQHDNLLKVLSESQQEASGTLSLQTFLLFTLAMSLIWYGLGCT